jgi:hypothetical protein
MTGDPGGYTSEGLLGPGVAGVLHKPFTLDRLEQSLRRALAG